MISNLLRADAPSDVPAPVKPRRYALDNAGKLYPSVATKDWSSVYRVSIMMRETVDVTLLQKAVNRVLPRFPTMAVRLHRGFFWYTLEENLLPFIVRKDSGPICFRFRWDEDNGYLLRILYRERQISVEFFHSVTDGHGSLVFTKTLLAEYLRCCGYTVPSEKGVLDIRQAVPDRELEDTFMRMPLPREGLPRGGAEAFHLSGNPSPLKITSAYMSVQMVLEKARSMDTTVTEYLASAMLYAAVRLQAQSKPEKYKPVRISIPVDMRKYFETATLRNFSMYVNPEISVEDAQKAISFEEIIPKVRVFLDRTLTKEYLFAGIATNVLPEKIPFVPYVPLPIKNLVIRGVFLATGDRLVTTTLTNLGVIQAPEELLAHVEHFDFVLGPSSPRPCCNCALTTTGDTMALTFSSNLDNDAFAEGTLQFLREQGLDMRVIEQATWTQDEGWKASITWRIPRKASNGFWASLS